MSLHSRIQAFLNPNKHLAELTYLRQQLVDLDEELKQSQLNEHRLSCQLEAVNELLGQAQVDAQAYRRRANRAEQDLKNERAFSKTMQRDLNNRIRAKR